MHVYESVCVCVFALLIATREGQMDGWNTLELERERKKEERDLPTSPHPAKVVTLP